MITAFIYTTQAVVKIRLKKFGLERDSNPWPLQNWCSALPCQLAKHPNMGAAKSFISRYSKQNIVVVEIVNCQFLASYHNEAVVSDSFRCYLFWYGCCYLLVRCVSHRKKKQSLIAHWYLQKTKNLYSRLARKLIKLNKTLRIQRIRGIFDK